MKDGDTIRHVIRSGEEPKCQIGYYDEAGQLIHSELMQTDDAQRAGLLKTMALPPAPQRTRHALIQWGTFGIALLHVTPAPDGNGLIAMPQGQPDFIREPSYRIPTIT